MRTIEVLGLPVAAIERAEALAAAEDLLGSAEPALLAFANAHACNLAARQCEFRKVLACADLLLPDGVGLAVAARVAGTAFPANLNGTDFLPQLLARAARRGCSVFLLGAAPGVAELAAERLQRPGLRVVGTAHGYQTDHAALTARIAASGAELLVVGMGMPRQERWLAEHLEATGVRLGVAAGAYLDFAAGAVRRAPPWMRAARLEWLFRLIGEPRRLFARYVLGNPAFLLRVLRARRRAG